MVSVRKVYLGFVCLPTITRRPDLTYTHTTEYQNRIRPVGLTWNLSQITDLFKREKRETLEDLQYKIVDSIIEPSSQAPDPESIFRGLNLEQRENFFNGLLSKWVKNGIRHSVESLTYFKEVVKKLNLTKDYIFSTIYGFYTRCNDTNTQDGLLLLYDIYKPENLQYDPIFTNKSYPSGSGPAYRIAKQKRRLVVREVLKILDHDLEEHSRKNPHSNEPLKSDADLIEMRNRLAEICIEDKERILRITKTDLSSISISLSNALWELDFYKKQTVPKIPEHMIELVNVDKTFCENIFYDMVDTRMIEITQIAIPKALNTPRGVHRLVVFRELLYEQLNHAKDSFNDWCELLNGRINKLREYGYDLSKYEVLLKPLKEVGGQRPYVNIRGICPEDPKLETPPQIDLIDESMFEGITEIPDMKEVQKGIDNIREDLKIFSHLPPEELSNFFIGKWDSEVKRARRSKNRRTRIRELNNPFNTTEDIPNIEEFEPPKPKVFMTSDDKPITPDLTEEEVADIVSSIVTQYYKHYINIKHLEWQVISADLLPVESIVKIYNAGQDITNPDPKKLTFLGPRFEKAFKDLDEFKKSTNSEADKYRRKLFYSGSEPQKPDSDKGNMQLFPDDPEILRKDFDLIKSMVDCGAAIDIRMRFPFIEMTPRPTPKQKESIFYRMTVSQPSPIYKCSKCDYRTFSDIVYTYDERTVAPMEARIYQRDQEFKCWNCGADRSSFEEVWPTGERGYQPVKYLKPINQENENDLF